MKVISSDGFKVCFFKENGKNIITIEKNGVDNGKLKNVPKNWGNFWFKTLEMTKNDPFCSCMEFQIDEMFLDFCAVTENYGEYSDIYKDINNVRPHFSREEWANVVNRAKKRKP